MAVYAIGDVQGCYDELAALLAQLHFDRARDTLWFTGDLVNRGPRSADVVRLVRDLGDNAIAVLGNHDLHLLAVAAGACVRGATDTFADLLGAEDRDVLLDWLRARPLLYHGAALGFTLIHAGLLPQWDLARARALAAEVEAQLRGPAYSELLHHMYGDAPDSWDESLNGWNRVRVIINSFTRLRYCDRDGRMDLRPVGAPGSHHPLLRHAKYLGVHKTAPCYTMFGMGPFPAITDGGSTAIIGEVFAVDGRTLSRLDEFEDCPAEYFRRRIVTPFGKAWVYVYRYAPKAAVIPTGDWCDR